MKGIKFKKMSENRLENIMNYLKNKNEIKTKTFLKKYELFNASQITLRRDLHRLEQKGLIRLSYGYIKVLGEMSFEIANENEHTSKDRMLHKKKMAEQANLILNDGDIIFVNTGTTCEEFVTTINKKIKLLVTNSFTTISRALKNKNIESLLFIGGMVDKTKNACFFNINYDFLNDIYFDKLFTSCVSIKNETDVFFDTIDENKLISRLLPNSSFNCLFIDDYKINKNALLKTFSINQFDKVIYYNS